MKIAKLEEKVNKVSADQCFEWKIPTKYEMAANRQEFRNVYGYTTEFVDENNLFGEQEVPLEIKGEDNGNSLEIKVGSNGQLNLLTKNNTGQGPQPLSK